MQFALMSGLVAFLATVLLIPQFITFYQAKRIEGQQMHEDVKQHQFKAGTPTMGGTVFLVVAILVSFIFAATTHMLTGGVIAILFILALYGLVGFLDDFLKIFRKINEGLNPKQKLALQILGGIVFYFVHVRGAGGGELNVFGYMLNLGVLYFPFVLFWLVGFSNAVNLTDGLDGLAAGSCAITSVAYVVIAVALGYTHFAIFGTALTGACLGFLFYNQHPAKMFMGDTGSLALGGALAAMAILTKTELLLILAGGLYVIEALSVIIQVISFKTRGVRVFKMSPIHHHFELSGWSEVKVVTVFWSFSALMAILSIIVVLACK